jgi:hypothetical protein
MGAHRWRALPLVVATMLLGGSAPLISEHRPIAHDLLPISDPGVALASSTSLRGHDGGCHDLRTPGGIDRALETGFGLTRHYDAVLPVDLGDGRSLWFVQDAFLDWVEDGPASKLSEMQYANSVAIAFDADGCSQLLVDGPNANGRIGFELSPIPNSVVWGHFFWPLAAVVEGGALSVTWAEMKRSPQQPTVFDGIIRHPGRTFVATYDIDTLERLSWERFDDLGFGFGFWAVAGTDGWTYHFGNRNLLNLAMNGGYENGPHPATDNYLGRGPSLAGGVTEVWDGTEWTTNLERAASVLSQGWAATMLRPRRDPGGRWVAAFNEEEFWGSDVVVLAAEGPTGPWREVSRYPATSVGDVPTVSYHATIVDMSACEASVVVSSNAADWYDAIADPDLYQPFLLQVTTC